MPFDCLGNGPQWEDDGGGGGNDDPPQGVRSWVIVAIYFVPLVIYSLATVLFVCHLELTEACRRWKFKFCRGTTG